MYAHVRGEVVFAEELLATHGALELLAGGVLLAVCHQVILPHKGAATLVANKGPDLLVAAHVLLQEFDASKALRTQGAAVLSVRGGGVLEEVYVQVTLDVEGSTAHATRVRLGSGVRAHVRDHGGPLQCLVAHLAADCLGLALEVLGVVFAANVLHQSAAVHELLEAVRAPSRHASVLLHVPVQLLQRVEDLIAAEVCAHHVLFEFFLFMNTFLVHVNCLLVFVCFVAYVTRNGLFFFLLACTMCLLHMHTKSCKSVKIFVTFFTRE